MVDKIIHKVRYEQWTNIIKECPANGMNKTAWCREHGISDKSFFHWQHMLLEEAYFYTTAEISSPDNAIVPWGMFQPDPSSGIPPDDQSIGISLAGFAIR